VLFLYGIALSGSDSVAMLAAGGALGLALDAAMSALMYFGLLRVPARHLFKVTSRLIALLAAGIAAQVMAFLAQADIVTLLGGIVCDTSHIVSDGSVLGKVLHTLIGYSDRPTAMQLVVYVTTLASIFTLMRLFGGVPSQPSHRGRSAAARVATPFVCLDSKHRPSLSSQTTCDRPCQSPKESRRPAGYFWLRKHSPRKTYADLTRGFPRRDRLRRRFRRGRERP
jgi:hypothetical protein